MTMFHMRLKQLKDESGETQAKIAEEIGITPQALSYYVNGREPSYDVLIKIARYFNCTTDYLLGLTDAKNIENQQRNERRLNIIKRAANYLDGGDGWMLEDIAAALAWLGKYKEINPDELISKSLGTFFVMLARTSKATCNAIKTNDTNAFKDAHLLSMDIKEYLIMTFMGEVTSFSEFLQKVSDKQGMDLFLVYSAHDDEEPPTADDIWDTPL